MGSKRVGAARDLKVPPKEHGDESSAPGPVADPNYLEERFAHIHQQLEIQLTRMGQIQAQMDHLQKLMAELKERKG